MFRLDDDWVWDSWIADDGELYHLFFLRAPRSLGDPGKRHTHATIGHATSSDLIDWIDLGTALAPDPRGWDDLSLWTGSVVRDDHGRWLMFFTALNTDRGHGVHDQRIGVAESDNLTTWTRVLDRPAVEPDSRWYKTLRDDSTASETWRDPFVFRDPDGDGWRMLITARAVGAELNDDGVLGQARSFDLLHWEVGPPITEAGSGFGQLEVAQVRVIDGTAVLVFTCHPQEQTDEHLARYGRYSTWSVVGESITGPWDIAAAQPFQAEPALFAAPLVQQRDRTWALIGFRNLEPEGVWSFEILDPIPITVDAGALRRV
ncbi:MAG: glycosyl hydrolase family 32 [Pseudonocardiales bacterium]|nr:glycoside hydrolase family 68 protein [Actinomycetota bacterium]